MTRYCGITIAGDLLLLLFFAKWINVDHNARSNIKRTTIIKVMSVWKIMFYVFSTLLPYCLYCFIGRHGHALGHVNPHTSLCNSNIRGVCVLSHQHSAHSQPVHATASCPPPTPLPLSPWFATKGYHHHTLRVAIRHTLTTCPMASFQRKTSVQERSGCIGSGDHGR